MIVKYTDPPFMVSYMEDTQWKSMPFKNLDDAVKFSRYIRKNANKENIGSVNVTQQTSDYYVTTYIDSPPVESVTLNFTINKNGVVIP